MTFRESIAAINGRRKTFIGVFLSVFALVVVISLVLPDQYLATASVVVESKADPVGAAGISNNEQMFTSYLATQIDIIGSERVAGRVVKMLKLDQVAQFRELWEKSEDGLGDINQWLAKRLQKRMTVTPSRESGVVSISVKWPDAKAAAAIANAFAQAYIDTTIDLKVEPAKQFAGWFDQRSKELHADLESRQRKLSDFQNQSQLTATDVRLDIENARLAELSTQLTTIQLQRQDAESRQHRIQGNNEHLPEVLQSPVIGSLKASLAVAAAKLDNIGVTLGRNHPDYQNAAAEVASLRERVAQETEKVAASLANVTQTNLQKESEVRAAMEAQRRRVLELKHQRDQLDVLQSDVSSAQHNLDAVAQRLAQSSLESQLQQANVLLLTAATEPSKPTGPNLALEVILGFFLAALVAGGSALGFEALDPRVRRWEDAVRLLSVPMLGSIHAAQSTRRRLDFVPLPRFLRLQRPTKSS